MALLTNVSKDYPENVRLYPKYKNSVQLAYLVIVLSAGNLRGVQKPKIFHPKICSAIRAQVYRVMQKPSQRTENMSKA